MSDYKVSALKYRPQRFDEVISQEFVTQTLKNAIKLKKMGHSYLVSGPRGTGKTTIARIFAKALNCPNRKDGEPCNECENCVEITKGIHPDVFELDAASNRGIDDVRAIQDAAKYYPVKAKYKFFIVDEVHMLTQQAFNAMLKILEEPPPYLIFILATTNPEKIPQTIVSRCQRFNLHRFKIDEITDRLRNIAENEKIKIDDESLFLIAKLGDGALRDALGVFDLAVSFCGSKITVGELKEFLNLPGKEVYFKISEYIKNSDASSILKYFDELIDLGFDLQTFFNGISEHFRDLLIIKTTKNLSLLDESDVIRKKYLKESENFSEEQILRILKILFDDEYRFRSSGNQKILLETILVELCRINKEVIDLEKLITGLEEFKKKTSDISFAENIKNTAKYKETSYRSEYKSPPINDDEINIRLNVSTDIPKSGHTSPEDMFRNMENKLKNMFDTEEVDINNNQ
ncbi:MAG: DNA polymerase III subunit gamma/tau [Ignavibacteria bacterium]|nr:DNA polymerase III subunit gamma/tau [Ignavibacteria bacterium]